MGATDKHARIALAQVDSSREEVAPLLESEQHHPSSEGSRDSSVGPKTDVQHGIIARRWVLILVLRGRGDIQQRRVASSRACLGHRL